MEKLRIHNITLQSGRITLRTMTENDWDVIHWWDTDPMVLYYSDSNDVIAYSMEESKGIYRGISQTAFIFIAEYSGKRIGYCWLQKMNLPEILKDFLDLDCRRIDLAIGDKDLWGQGIGTQIIKLLTDYGFSHEKADAIFGCSIADYNIRSRRAFEKNGYILYREIINPEGSKAHSSYDLILRKDEYYNQHSVKQSN